MLNHSMCFCLFSKKKLVIIELKLYLCTKLVPAINRQISIYCVYSERFNVGAFQVPRNLDQTMAGLCRNVTVNLTHFQIMRLWNLAIKSKIFQPRVGDDSICFLCLYHLAGIRVDGDERDLWFDEYHHQLALTMQISHLWLSQSRYVADDVSNWATYEHIQKRLFCLMSSRLFPNSL